VEALEPDAARLELNTRQWQEDYLKRVLDIRLRYREFIQKLGYTDKIFYLKPDAAVIPFSPRKLIFVNQYYFSKLEKHLVKMLEEAGCEILILHQGPQGSFNLDDLSSKAFALHELDQDDLRLRQLKIVEAANQEQMALACLCEFGKGQLLSGGSDSDPTNTRPTGGSDADPTNTRPTGGSDADPTNPGCKSGDQEITRPTGDQEFPRPIGDLEIADPRRILIDSGFASHPYSRYFDPSAYRYSHALSMQDTRLFQMLHSYGRQLKALAASKNQRFLLLSEIARAIAVPGFVSYYLPGWTESERARLLDQLRLLSGSSVLYIDLDLNLFADDKSRERYDLLYELLAGHFATLEQLLKIDSLEALISCFDTPKGLDLKRLCASEDEAGAQVLDSFYERLANFMGAESLGFVTDWHHIFRNSGPELAAGIWKLWLDNLGGAMIGKYSSPPDPLYETGNLLDSRNIRYDEVIVLNCVEGVLPANPEPVWLLNEVQCKKLGIKHYELVRQWERYYFLRLILGSERVELYTYKDQDRDLEPGSYLGELRQQLKDGGWPGISLADYLAKLPASLLSQAEYFLGSKAGLREELDASGICGIDALEAFFTLPCDPQTDFPDGIESAYYDLSLLASNPFAWYVQIHRGIRERNLLPKETITPMLFGSIMHSFLSKVLHQLDHEQSGTQGLKRVFSDKTGLKKILEEMLGSPQYDHKLPQNYNRDFLFGVISDCLVDSVSDFYSEWLEPKLRGQDFCLIPEEEYMTDAERYYKTLLSFGDNQQYVLKIRGKADLRISTSNTDYIVDFKTGQADMGQLIFYEYLYYLLDPIYPGGSETDPPPRTLTSLFWMILDARRDGENITENKRKAWLDKLSVMLEDCLASGYGLGSRTADRERLKQITRADLWTNTTGRES